MILTTKEDKKPLVMFHATNKTWGNIQTLDGQDAEQIVLDTLPKFYRGVYANNLTIMEPFQEKAGKTTMNYAGIKGGIIERIFQKDENEFNKIRLEKETADTVVIEEDSLITYGIPANEAIIATNDHNCGLEQCSDILTRKEDSPNEPKHKLNQGFLEELTEKISENLREKGKVMGGVKTL